MRTLHLVRKRRDEFALSVLKRQGGYDEVTCVLLQDAVLSPPDLPVPCYALREDVEARGTSLSIPLIDMHRLVEMIFEHDSIICW